MQVSEAWYLTGLKATSGRNQKVKIDEFWSNLENIDISVLQGSILGVILFVIFTNDLSRATNSTLAVQFADDYSSFISHRDLNELNRIANYKFILFRSLYDNPWWELSLIYGFEWL